MLWRPIAALPGDESGNAAFGGFHSIGGGKNNRIGVALHDRLGSATKSKRASPAEISLRKEQSELQNLTHWQQKLQKGFVSETRSLASSGRIWA
jgi:hypothetical protein